MWFGAGVTTGGIEEPVSVYARGGDRAWTGEGNLREREREADRNRTGVPKHL